MIGRKNKIHIWNELYSIVAVKYKHSSISGRLPTGGMKNSISTYISISIWLNCRRLRSPFSQLKTLCKSMSRQHLGLATKFLSQGMGWPRRRFIHLPSESPCERESNRDRLYSNRSPWPLYHCVYLKLYHSVRKRSVTIIS